MAPIKEPELVKPICGILARSETLLPAVRERLATVFGPADLESDVWPFDFTDYYETEMGPGLWRQFVSFERRIDPAALAKVKVVTDRIEREFLEPRSGRMSRRVNLDPGYVTPAKLVLATTKDFAHRIYLGEGIYGEVTLNFRRGGIETLPWTYPDYASGRYAPFLLKVRNAMLCK